MIAMEKIYVGVQGRKLAEGWKLVEKDYIDGSYYVEDININGKWLDVIFWHNNRMRCICLSNFVDLLNFKPKSELFKFKDTIKWANKNLSMTSIVISPEMANNITKILTKYKCITIIQRTQHSLIYFENEAAKEAFANDLILLKLTL